MLNFFNLNQIILNKKLLKNETKNLSLQKFRI